MHSPIDSLGSLSPAKKFPAGKVGFFGGIAGFAATMYFAPSVVQGATYAIAGAVSSVLGASVGVYLAAMVAVGLAAAFAGALIGVALRSLFELASSKPREELSDESLGAAAPR